MSNKPPPPHTPTPHGRLKDFNKVIEVLRDYPLKTVAISVAESLTALEAAQKAFALGIAKPVLYGNQKKIEEIISNNDLDFDNVEIYHFDNYIDAANAAAMSVGTGKADMLMKGQIHSDDFLRSIIKRDHKLLQSGQLLTHIFVLEATNLDRFLFVTDAAVNIAPDLEKKALIAANAIFLANVLGIEKPNIAVLSAVEVVNPNIPSTIDAAVLAKMFNRKQIKFGKIDGPFALDNAISIESAQTKGIESEVAGLADILLVPNLESGNMLAKSFTYLANGTMAGIVMGAKAPIILPSRSDSARSKLTGIALGVLTSNMVTEKFVKLGKVHL